jgi:hypothetical protein
MSIAAAPEQSQAFDPSEYDLEGTPTLEGAKATKVTVSFEAFDLDRTDEQHMLLAGKLDAGETVTVSVTAKATKLGWTERPDAPPLGEKGSEDRRGRRYTLTIRDVTA